VLLAHIGQEQDERGASVHQAGGGDSERQERGGATGHGERRFAKWTGDRSDPRITRFGADRRGVVKRDAGLPRVAALEEAARLAREP